MENLNNQNKNQNSFGIPHFPKFPRLKKVGVLGLGVSGLAALKVLNCISEEIIVVNLGALESWEPKIHQLKLDPLSHMTLLSQDQSCNFDGCQLIILSPGIERSHPLLIKPILENIPIINEIELSYQMIQSVREIPIVGVTGTNGKTTTVTLMGELFRLMGKKVFVGGNIGVPLCELIFAVIQGKDSLESYEAIILELSSFQLESLDQFCPDIAVITNIEANHQERYLKIDDYFEAKFNITKKMIKENLLKTLIIPHYDRKILTWAESERDRKELKLKLFDKDWNEKKDWLKENGFHLIGPHNRVNFQCAFFAYQEIWGRGFTEDQLLKTLLPHLSKFQGVHFRLEMILKDKIFNDAKSTNFLALKQALATLNSEYPDYDKNVIIGGKLRGGSVDWGEINQLSEIFKGVKKIYLMGESTDKLSRLFSNSILKSVEYYSCYDLEKSIKKIKLTLPNFLNEKSIILFSPGFPSFDQFENYEARGEKFNELLKSSLLI
jgi:UDP-N-acetylmuramoylalanine--D-glutamate ligase